MAQRVVVTGMGVITALGDSWPVFKQNLADKVSGVVRLAEWDRFKDLNTRLAAPVPHFSAPADYPRKKNPLHGPRLPHGHLFCRAGPAPGGPAGGRRARLRSHGVAYGSCTGSPDAVADFGTMLVNGDMSGVTATTYIRMMGHTAAVNIGLFLASRAAS